MERLDQANIQRLIVNTVTMLCKNSMSYSNTLHIQGTLGITVDASRVVLIQLNECFDGTGSHCNATVHDGRGAVDSSQALPVLKRPRMSSVVQCPRRPVGHGRMRIPVPPVRRVRSGHVVVGATGSVQRARPQMSVPSPRTSKVALTKPTHTPVPQVTPSSPHFHAGHVAARNETPQQLPAKPEVKAEGLSAFQITRPPMSSDVICVESDDEPENAPEMKPCISNTQVNSVTVKSEAQSADALQMILNRAVIAARASNPRMTNSSFSNTVDATTSQRSASSSDSCVDDVHYGDPAHSDIKPTVESTGVVARQWSPSKLLMLSPSKMLPTGIKTEVGAHSPIFSSSKLLHPVSTSRLHSSVVPTAGKGISPQNPTSWTSVTETTFICTTAGCAKRFTTKRALVRHQKDKHGLVTRHMMAAGGQMDSDSNTDSGM